MPSVTHNHFADFLAEIESDRVKSAAAPLSEPGGYAGASTHPSADAPDGVIKSKTGFRFSENTTDAKDNRERPSVDATADASTEGGEGTPKQDKVQLNIGTNQSSTGADPSVEDDFKGDKEDPGTTSVMKADDGEKYAQYKAMGIDALTAHLSKVGNAILADVANAQVHGKQASSYTPPAAPAPTPSQLKAASLDQANELIGHTIKEAGLSAELVIAHLVQCEKIAAEQDDAATSEDHSAPGDASSGLGDSASAGGGPGGGDSGGGDAGGAPAGALGGMGGPSPGAGGPPGMPPGLDGAIAGSPAPANPDQALHELAAALMEMGVDPAQLAEIAQGMAAGGGAGGPGGPPAGPGGPPGGDPGLGGPPSPEKLAYANNLYKMAHAVNAYKRSGKFRFTEPKTAEAAKLRGQMHSYLAEAVRLS